MKLFDYQRNAIARMHNGCILCGGVGSGKSCTALGYFYVQNGGDLSDKHYIHMKKPNDLYIITTAHKRDTLEWEEELLNFRMSTHPEGNYYKNKVVVDSWNNIQRYEKVQNAFFIFDEQRVVGYGTWAKTFIKIAQNNQWILLSATPGDTWKDYMAVFIANGFYKNKTEFEQEHVVWNYRVSFPQIDRYIGVERLTRLRDKILVTMEDQRHTIQHHENICVDFDLKMYHDTSKYRWNYFTDQPIINASEFCQLLRHIVNTDESRVVAILEILEKHPRVIIFYNYDYELEILRNMCELNSIEYAEWNGHKHQDIPNCSKWCYLSQYTAGAEGWNCVQTDTIIFYSQTYSYKVLIQACGRIDRLNTSYKDLWYYHLCSKSKIDLAIGHALKDKKDFNEGRFFNGSRRKQGDL